MNINVNSPQDICAKFQELQTLGKGDRAQAIETLGAALISAAQGEEPRKAIHSITIPGGNITGVDAIRKALEKLRELNTKSGDEWIKRTKELDQYLLRKEIDWGKQENGAWALIKKGGTYRLLQKTSRGVEERDIHEGDVLEKGLSGLEVPLEKYAGQKSLKMRASKVAANVTANKVKGVALLALLASAGAIYRMSGGAASAATPAHPESLVPVTPLPLHHTWHHWSEAERDLLPANVSKVEMCALTQEAWETSLEEPVDVRGWAFDSLSPTNPYACFAPDVQRRDATECLIRVGRFNEKTDILTLHRGLNEVAMWGEAFDLVAHSSDDGDKVLKKLTEAQTKIGRELVDRHLKAASTPAQGKESESDKVIKMFLSKSKDLEKAEELADLYVVDAKKLSDVQEKIKEKRTALETWKENELKRIGDKSISEYRENAQAIKNKARLNSQKEITKAFHKANALLKKAIEQATRCYQGDELSRTITEIEKERSELLSWRRGKSQALGTGLIENYYGDADKLMKTQPKSIEETSELFSNRDAELKKAEKEAEKFFAGDELHETKKAIEDKRKELEAWKTKQQDRLGTEKVHEYLNAARPPQSALNVEQLTEMVSERNKALDDANDVVTDYLVDKKGTTAKIEKQRATLARWEAEQLASIKKGWERRLVEKANEYKALKQGGKTPNIEDANPILIEIGELSREVEESALKYQEEDLKKLRSGIADKTKEIMTDLHSQYRSQFIETLRERSRLISTDPKKAAGITNTFLDQQVAAETTIDNKKPNEALFHESLTLQRDLLTCEDQAILIAQQTEPITIEAVTSVADRLTALTSAVQKHYQWISDKKDDVLHAADPFENRDRLNEAIAQTRMSVARSIVGQLTSGKIPRTNRLRLIERATQLLDQTETDVQENVREEDRERLLVSIKELRGQIPAPSPLELESGWARAWEGVTSFFRRPPKT